jgi:hypothetical protein
MKRLLVVCAVFAVSIAQAQGSRDTLKYNDSVRVTTTWGKTYLGPVGVQKLVNIAIDTTSSTQTVLFFAGAAADSNNPAKKTTLRLAYRLEYNGYPTLSDTLWVKTLGGTVPKSVAVYPQPPFLAR